VEEDATGPAVSSWRALDDATGPLVRKIFDGFLKDSGADSSSSVVTSSPCLFCFQVLKRCLVKIKPNGPGPNLFMFLTKFLEWPDGAWPPASYESEANDGEFLESDLATTAYRVSKSLLDHELELLASKINLFIEMALKLVDDEN